MSLTLQSAQSVESIASEILLLKQQTAKNMVKYGHYLLGQNATMGQITNLVGPRFGMTPKDCLYLIISSAYETDGEILE